MGAETTVAAEIVASKVNMQKLQKTHDKSVFCMSEGHQLYRCGAGSCFCFNEQFQEGSLSITAVEELGNISAMRR